LTPALRLLACSWLLLPACAPGYTIAAAHTEVREIEVAFQDAAPRALELQVHSGCILMQPGPELQCRLRLEVAAATPDAARAIADALVPSVDEAGNGGRTRLNVALPQGAAIDALVVTCQVRIPPATAVEVRTRQAAVIARDLTSDLTVDAGDGSLEATMAGGSVQATSTGGRLTLRGCPRASLRTGTGRIEVLVAPSTLLDIDAGDGVVLLDLETSYGLDVRYHGDQANVVATPEMRIDWQEVEKVGPDEFLLGRFGAADATQVGRLTLATGLGSVLLRRARTASEPK